MTAEGVMAARSLLLETEDEVIAEIAHLRKGHRQLGNWTLAQICWHVSRPVQKYLSPPEPMDLAPTTEQAAKKTGFVDYVIAHKKPPPYIKEAPPQMIPPPTANDADIDAYIEDLNRLKAYPHPKVLMGPIGPVTADEFRKCNVYHASHHLAFLEPTTPRRRQRLKYAGSRDIIQDVATLQSGYDQTGNWNLDQICWHLAQTINFRMNPGPHPANTPEQDARKPIFDNILATGQLPNGIVAPDPLVPPAIPDAGAIESLVAALEKFENYHGPMTPHRLFGHMTESQAKQLNLIHCAHHLSYLVPTIATKS